MKYRTILSILFVLFMVTPTTGQNMSLQGFTLKGTVEGQAEGVKVYLNKDGTRGHALDSTVIRNHAFSFKGQVDYPQLFTVAFHTNKENQDNERPPYQPTVSVFIENTDITMSTNVNKLPKSFGEAYQQEAAYNLVTVKGSSSDDLYRQYKHGLEPLAQKRSDIFDEYISYLNPEPNEEKGPMSEGISIVNRIDQAAERRDNYIKQFIKDHRNSFVAVHVAKNNLGKYSVQEISNIEGMFSGEIKNSEAWPDFASRAKDIKKTAVGANYVDLDLKDSKGNSVQLSDYVGKGHYVLLNFWASWCGPCRADIPHIKEVYGMYNPDRFQIISISMDTDKKAWLKAVKEEKMEWPQLSNLKGFEGKVSGEYNFRGIPTDILVGPDGMIITRRMRGSWMDRKLIELYGNKFAANN